MATFNLVSATTEIRESPTKPSGKGNKRKQDELDEDDDVEEEAAEEAEEEEGRQTWVEALTQELNDEDEGQEADPDYEVGDLHSATSCPTRPPIAAPLSCTLLYSILFFPRRPCLVELLKPLVGFLLLCVTHVSP